MRLDPSPFGPGVSAIVVIDIRDQNTVARFVNDQPDVTIDPSGPKMRILALVDAMQLQTVPVGFIWRRRRLPSLLSGLK